MLLALNSFLGRWDGIVLLIGFAAFMTYTLLRAKKGQAEAQTEQTGAKQQNPWLVALQSIIMGSVARPLVACKARTTITSET